MPFCVEQVSGKLSWVRNLSERGLAELAERSLVSPTIFFESLSRPHQRPLRRCKKPAFQGFICSPVVVHGFLGFVELMHRLSEEVAPAFQTLARQDGIG